MCTKNHGYGWSNKICIGINLTHGYAERFLGTEYVN